MPAGFSDAELLALFERDPQRAWECFLDRYSGRILGILRRLGFDYDGAMERFVYVCEKLAEDDWRRLRAIERPGTTGELTPWLVRVVHNLSINWAAGHDGRRRINRAVARLDAFDQEVFAAYFWEGLRPAEVHQRLRAARPDLDLPEVLDSLERVFASLSANKIWRLVSNLTRRRPPVSLADAGDDSPLAARLASAEPTPEEAALRSESETLLEAALAELEPLDRLLLQMRYEEGLPVRETAAALGLDESETRGKLKTARRRLRRRLSAKDMAVLLE
jgi:RNA polymerase sigma factor (sigma-70 family)